eukprot:2797054-Rhodomonas_salina.2
MPLHVCCAVSGTAIAHGGISLRAPYTVSGTQLAYAGVSLRDVRYCHDAPYALLGTVLRNALRVRAAQCLKVYRSPAGWPLIRDRVWARAGAFKLRRAPESASGGSQRRPRSRATERSTTRRVLLPVRHSTGGREQYNRECTRVQYGGTGWAVRRAPWG